MYEKFPIGFWNYQKVSVITEKDVKDWAECGMTLTLSPNFDPAKDDPAHMLHIMDLCHEAGIKLIICHSDCIWFGAAENPGGYAEKFKAAYELFGHHPATFGFHIGDEPNRNYMDDVVAAYRIQKQIAPELSPFINFLPFWNGEYVGYKDFNEFVSLEMPRLQPDMLCYDRYTQMNPEIDGVNDYFFDLRNHYEAALTYNVPLWTTLLCVGHFRYRVPSEDDLRWQLNSALCCGCRGILWFMFYLRAPHSNYRKAPIDMFGHRTETYNALSNVLNTYNATVADTFNKLTLTGTYHLGKSYGGYPLYKDGDGRYITHAETLHGIDAIISFYKDDEGGHYMAIMNNSCDISGQLALTIPKANGHMYRVGPIFANPDVFEFHHDEGMADNGDSVIFYPWLAPGQLNLYKIN